jgi:hypothetical protein
VSKENPDFVRLKCVNGHVVHAACFMTAEKVECSECEWSPDTGATDSLIASDPSQRPKLSAVGSFICSCMPEMMCSDDCFPA